MSKPGPVKTPTATLDRRGSWRAKDRAGEPEPVGKPNKPKWLSGDAASMWLVLVGQLDAMGVLGSVDTNALGRYCQIYARWRECEAFIDANGMINKVGGEYVQVGRSFRLADQLLKLEVQFGMTPSARASLTITPRKSSKEPDGKKRFFAPKLTG